MNYAVKDINSRNDTVKNIALIKLTIFVFVAFSTKNGYAQKIPGYLKQHITDEQTLSGHLVKQGETIEAILKDYGNGASGSPFRIQGPGGVLEQTKNLNPNIKNWNKLKEGTYIYVPVARKQRTIKNVSQAPPATTLKNQSNNKDTGSLFAVSYVKQQAGYLKSNIELSDGNELKDAILSLSNTIRIGKYLSGEIRIASSTIKPQYETSFDDLTVSRLNYKSYTTIGSILVPAKFGTFGLRGGLTKTSINTPKRSSEGSQESSSLPVNRPNAPFVPMLGFSYEYVTHNGSFVRCENLATSWNDFSFEQGLLSAGFGFQQT